MPLISEGRPAEKLRQRCAKYVRKARRRAYVIPFKVFIARLQLVDLIAPTQAPLSIGNSHPQIFSKSGIRYKSSRALPCSLTAPNNTFA